MSQITNIVNTIYRASGSQAISESRAVAAGIGGIGRQLNDSTRMSERFNSQWKAIGTTLRYALAGTAVFGLTSLVGQLKDVQQQLGLISAIGSGAGGLPITGKTLDTLFAQSQRGAVESLTPVKDYNDAILNLLSTVQNVPEDQITPIVTEISRAAKLAQISAEDATKAFTTMNVAFGKPTNLANIHQMAQEFFILTQQAPGGVQAGQQVIGQLGQLAQVTKLAHGTPEDMFSLLLTTLRSGIPPSQAGRGLQYLIQTLALPGQQSKGATAALGSVGITTGSNLTLQQRITRVLAKARSLGVHGDLSSLKNADDETLADLESSGNTTQGLQSFGISGQGAAFLGTVFKRIHALRTALAIEGGTESGTAQADLKLIQDSSQGHVSDVNSLAAAWKRFSKQAQLQRAVVALNAMSLQVANDLAPVLNFAGGKVAGLQSLADKHRTATKIGVLGGAAALAGLGIARFTGLLGGGGGSTIARGEALRDIGATGLGASPAHPMYVIVVGQLFNPRGKGGIVAGVEEDAAAGGGGGRFSKLGAFLGRNKKVLGYAGARVAAAVAFQKYVVNPLTGTKGDDLPSFFGWDGHFGGGHAFNAGYINKSMKQYPRIHQFFDAANTKGQGAISSQWSNVMSQFIGGKISASQLDKILGRADVYMTIDVTKDGKTTQKRVHIPVDLWSGGRHPSSRGKKAVKNG